MPQWRACVDKAILPLLMLPDTCQSHRPGRGVTLTHTQCQSSGPAVLDHYLLLKVWVTSTANCTHCHTNVQNTLEMTHAPLHISKIFIVRILKCDLHILEGIQWCFVIWNPTERSVSNQSDFRNIFIKCIPLFTTKENIGELSWDTDSMAHSRKHCSHILSIGFGESTDWVEQAGGRTQVVHTLTEFTGVLAVPFTHLCTLVHQMEFVLRGWQVEGPFNVWVKCIGHLLSHTAA